jgi:HEAT repeat protein
LLRLYDKHGRRDALARLGLRLLKGEKRFEGVPDMLKAPDMNLQPDLARENLLDCIRFVLSRMERKEDLEALREVAKNTPSLPIKNEILRRLDGNRAARVDTASGNRAVDQKVEVRTLGAPPGVKVLASRDDVWCISEDGEWIGTSWGVVRYRNPEKGVPEMLQVPLSGPVRAICRTPAGLFVWSQSGLYRLGHPDGRQPALERIDFRKARGEVRYLNKHCLERLDSEAAEAERRRADEGWMHLLWCEARLWINDGDEVFSYDPARQEVCHHGEHGQLFAAHGKLWAPRAVFDPSQGDFVPFKEIPEGMRLFGASRDELWAEFEVNAKVGSRPALVHPRPLAWRTLAVERPVEGASRQPVGSFDVLGEDRDHVWLETPDGVTEFDRATGRLFALPRPQEDTGYWGRGEWLLSLAKRDCATVNWQCMLSVPFRLPGFALEGASFVQPNGGGPSTSQQDLPPVVTTRVVLTPDQRLQDLAARRFVSIARPADLVAALADPNPHIRERAVMAVLALKGQEQAPFIAAFEKAVRDEHLPVRMGAAIFLEANAAPVAKPLLEVLLQDKALKVRRLAALALARLGARPHWETLDALLERLEQSFSSDDWHLRWQIHMAVAPHGDQEAIIHLLRHPLKLYLNGEKSKQMLGRLEREYADNLKELFGHLGRAIREHPAWTGILLRAEDPRTDVPDPESAMDYAARVFQEAGPSLLPVLLAALRSDDRVVRSNAARGCGAIGDRRAIPHLLKALDLESGLSRASIVRALGELRAKEALPDLVNLYVDIAIDADSATGAGFRWGEMTATQFVQYDRLRNLDALKGAYENLDAVVKPRGANPARYERLLQREDILAAITKIGARHAQGFCRDLACMDELSRTWSAEHLADGGAADWRANLPILRNLLSDNEEMVRVQAAVSLHLLGQDKGRRMIKAWLNESEEGLRTKFAECLQRRAFELYLAAHEVFSLH